MIRQRSVGAAPVVRARAEALPFATGAFDAAMATLTIHHWADQSAGIAEMKRVARKRVVVLTWVLDAAPFWLTDDYLPEFVTEDRTRFFDEARLMKQMTSHFSRVVISPVPIPHDCTDGFLAAYWRRPAAYLNPAVQSGISSFAIVDAKPGIARLSRELKDGTWQAKYGHVNEQTAADFGYRLVQCDI